MNGGRGDLAPNLRNRPMAQMKIHELAKKHGVSSNDMLALLTELGYNPKSHSSAATDEMVSAVEDHYEDPGLPGDGGVSNEPKSEPEPKAKETKSDDPYVYFTSRNLHNLDFPVFDEVRQRSRRGPQLIFKAGVAKVPKKNTEFLKQIRNHKAYQEKFFEVNANDAAAARNDEKDMYYEGPASTKTSKTRQGNIVK